jgi:hypothetical protein
MNKLTQEELNQVTELTQRYQSTIYELGIIEKNISELNKQLKKVDDEKQALLVDLDKIDSQELELSIKLREKYGEGTINPQTGEIKPL